LRNKFYRFPVHDIHADVFTV